MIASKKFKFIVLLGKSGSGKGTQADLLVKRFGLKHLSTGTILRRRCEKKDFLGGKLKKILQRGGLVPTPLVFHLWLHALETFRKDKTCKGVVMEGSPRKLYEAWMLKETLDFYNWGDDVRVFHIAISDKEALKRLLKRGRPIDDQIKAIKSRLLWFKKEVMPAISFYKKGRVLFEINGEQTIENVHKEILRKLKTFLR